MGNLENRAGVIPHAAHQSGGELDFNIGADITNLSSDFSQVIYR